MQTASTSSRTRRIDIDILRAVAVLSVIFFHFEVPGFSGGFLGVDIFFVISGYLITLHINEQLVSNSFSFTSFYARRIRRLFPALIATLIVSSIAALAILPKSLLQDFAYSQIAASTYVSNIYFWSIADYFDTQSIVKPLLHTWSLSVEEQFYLLWPLLIVLSFRRKQTIIIAALGALSVLAAELTFNESPSSAFYLFPFRIFEFAIGALVGKVRFSRPPTFISNVLLITAASAVLASLFLITENTRNPGLLSLPLCLGVGLIIGLSHPWANANNFITKPLLRIGLVSYSAYLVHWPLLVFLKVYRPEDLSGRTIFWLCAATYLLAEILFNFVERPTAKVSLERNKRRVFLAIPALMLFSIAFALGYQPAYNAIGAIGYGGKARAEVQQILDQIPERESVLSTIKQKIDERALKSQIEKTKKIVVIGDSHSVDVSLALQYLLIDSAFSVENLPSICDPLTIDSIPVTLNLLYKNHAQDEVKNPQYCQEYHETLVTELQVLSPDIVVFSEDWGYLAIRYLPDTVRRIKENTGAKVLILGRTPIFWPHPNIVLRGVGSPDQINAEANALSKFDYKPMDKLLSGIAIETNSSFISKSDLICSEEKCEILIGSEIGYVDCCHWSLIGMEHYGTALIEHPVFQTLLRE